MSEVLDKDLLEEDRRDDHGDGTKGQSDDSDQKPRGGRSDHPVAWSPISAENGVPRAGVTLMTRPQCPTITRADVERE